MLSYIYIYIYMAELPQPTTNHRSHTAQDKNCTRQRTTSSTGTDITIILLH